MIFTTLILLAGNFLAVCILLKKIIYISHQKHLFDEPGESRKIHLNKTPNLGGVAIFISFFLSCCFLISTSSITHVNHAVGAMLILFGLGLTDDLVGVNPLKKILAQLFAALLIAASTDLHLDTFLNPSLGISHLPSWLSISLTAFIILFAMNAMNLIDGINGLAGSIGLFATVAFSVFFWLLNDPVFFEISIVLCGCLAGFLLFNFTPARIFMGDTGSLFIGFILSLLSIRLLESDFSKLHFRGMQNNLSPLLIVLSLLAVPVFDTIRIFAIRVLKGKSPFDADRNHVHHILLDLGLSHMQATAVLLGSTISLFTLSFPLSKINILYAIPVLSFFVLTLFGILWYFRKSRLILTSQRKLMLSNPDNEYRTFVFFKPGKVIMKKDPSIIEEYPN